MSEQNENEQPKQPSKQDLIGDYLTLKAAVDEVSAMLAEAKVRQSELVGTVLSLYGQGPHDVGGVSCTIMVREGKAFFRIAAPKDSK